jgi:predicted MFS family arabinose efflux permease
VPGTAAAGADCVYLWIASAAWWNFGPDILQKHLHLEKETTSMLWLVSGGAGIAGVFTGALAARTGWNPVYWLSLLFMARRWRYWR